MKTLRTLLIAAVAILPGGMAHAANISISFLPPVLSAAPGGTVTFSGTIKNLEAVPVDLNGCGLTLPGQFTTDCSGPFLTNSPLTLAPGETSFVFDMFTVMVNVPYSGGFGLQPAGTFTVLGGLEAFNGTEYVYDPNSQNVLGSQTFQVNVAPEPGTVGLFMVGIPLLVVVRRRMI